MSPDASGGVQSRISAFEALASSVAAASKSAPSLLDAPLSPASKTYFPITPSPPAAIPRHLSGSPSPPSSPAIARKPSSVDLKDWVIDDGPLPYAPRQRRQTASARPTMNGFGTTNRHVSEPAVHSAVSHPAPPPPPPPLIQFGSPPGAKSAPPLPPRKASYSSLKSVSVSNSSSSSLPRSPVAPPPPLPQPQMRKKSDSLTVDHSYPPLAKLGISIPSRGVVPGHAQASSISSFHSVSLSSDGGTDPTTPGSLSNFVATYPIDRDDREAENGHEPDNVSLDESFENVSASSVVSPSVSSLSNDWAEYVRRPEPPKLPQRPRKSSTAPPTPMPASRPAPTSVTGPVSVSYAVRSTSTKPPPPPPPPSRTRPPSSNRSSLTSTITSSSDRSSIISTATSRTSISSVRPVLPLKPPTAPSVLTRPAPIPPTARRRYEAVFVGNVRAQRRTKPQPLSRHGSGNGNDLLSPPPNREARRAAGWRGLSVDLITNPEEISASSGISVGAGPPAPASGEEKEKEKETEIGTDERLDGRTVALIWHTSRLDRAKLKDIWHECDGTTAGSLSRDEFVKGMWRIDEELRRAQLKRHSGPSPAMHGMRQPVRSATLLH